MRAEESFTPYSQPTTRIAQAFYPVDGEYPEFDEPVDAFWDNDDFGTVKILPDDEGEPVWFRLDDGDWVITDEPVFWIKGNSDDKQTD